MFERPFGGGVGAHRLVEQALFRIAGNDRRPECLIHAFSAVSTANPAEKANLLSASISEAMNCTAFGLMVAVPMLFVHAFLQTKSSQLIDGLETAAIKFLNALTRRATAKVQAARIEPARAA